METTVDKLRRFLRQILRNTFIKMKKNDELFKDTTKQYIVPPKTVHTPEVENMNFFSKSKMLQKSFYDFPGGYVAQLNDVIYHTGDGTLATPSRTILLESINGWREKQKFSIRETYFSKVTTLQEDVMYSVFRSTNNGYYHTIIDNLPRLYLLSQISHISPLKLLLPGKLTKIEKFFIDRLLPTNVTLEYIAPRKSYLIKNIIFPSYVTCPFSGYLPPEYLAYFNERILPKRPRRKVNRIFISRGVNLRNPRRQRRRLLNEDILMEKLSQYGFKSYCLENMSIEEQINLFYDAEFVIGAHGAGLANIIFAENIGVLELFPSAYVLPYYYYLAKSLDHNYTYLHGNKNNIHADFSANINEIINVLKLYSL